MKKLLALALALALGLFAGSPESFVAHAEELEPVTLKWYYPGAELEGTADVMKVFNEKLADLLPNTTVEVVWMENFDPYAEQWPLLLSGGEVMDIAWEGWNTPLQQDALDGNVLPLTELIYEFAPNLVKEIEIWQDDWTSVTMDGEIYAIPCVQPSANMSTQLQINESVYKYFDAYAILEEAHANDKMTAKIYDLLEDGLQAAIDDGALVVGDNTWYIGIWAMLELGSRGYVSLDKSAMGGQLGNYFVDPKAETPEVMHYFELPEVRMAAERMTEWKEKGWITEAQYAEQYQDGAQDVLLGNSTLQGTWADLIDEKGIKMSTDDNGENCYTLLLDKPGKAYKGVASFGYATALAIPYTSSNPERVIMLMNILRDEVGTPGNELMNLLCYGFEANSPEAAAYGWANYTAETVDGQLYVDTSIRNGADAKHAMTNWAIANTFKTIHDGHVLTTREGKEFSLNFWTDVYPTMPECAVSGVVLDSTSITETLEAVNATLMEYRHRVRAGGGTELLDECVEKMNQAGLENIKTELEKQIAASVD